MSWTHKYDMRRLKNCSVCANYFWALALIIRRPLILPWKTDPPESTVPLTDADTTQHSLLVHHVLPQELADNVSAQTEAHHDQLCLSVRPLNVAYHGGKLPCATWVTEEVNKWHMTPRRDNQLLPDQISSSTEGAFGSRYQGYVHENLTALTPGLFYSRCFAFWLSSWYQYQSILFLTKKINCNLIKMNYLVLRMCSSHTSFSASDVLLRESLTIGKHAWRGKFDVGKSS